MAKASDNVFPKVIHGMQTSDPSAPADSSWKTYAKADGIYARSSNGIVGPFGAGSTFAAAGSNSKDVSGRSYAGASTTLLSPFDHEHLGVSAITSSSSNTLARPIVNIRPGANVGISASDTNGDGVFDTLTISATGSSGGGSSTPAKHGTHVYNSGAISLTNSSETSITFDSEREDTDAYHSTSVNTNRITIPTGLGGAYLWGASFRLTGTPASGAYVIVYQNGTDVIGLETFPAANGWIAVSGVFTLAQSDYIEVKINQNSSLSTVASDTSTAKYKTEFWAYLIGA